MKKTIKRTLTVIVTLVFLLVSSVATSAFFIDGVGPFPNLLNGTHRWLIDQGFDILEHEQFAVANWFCEDARALIWEYIDWPDHNERGGDLFSTIMGSWHSYRPEDSLCTIGRTAETAMTRFIFWYEFAIEQHMGGEEEAAFRALGKSIHYLTDLSSPPHTGERSFEMLFGTRVFNPIRVLYNGLTHFIYEAAVVVVQNNYAVQCGGLYDWFMQNCLEYIAHQTARYSVAFYQRMCRGAIQAPLERAQRNVAGVLYRFYHEAQMDGAIQAK